MAHRVTVVNLPLRLIPARGDSPRYRPLAIGLARIRRSTTSGPWWVQVSLDGCLRPVWHDEPSESDTFEMRCRAAITLLTPEDIQSRRPHRDRRRSGRCSGLTRFRGRDIYGWCLMYQPPGLHGVAMVDAHESFDELPAYYELPLELLDRMEFLARRGIPSRPLALLAEPDDFERPRTGGSLRNRFHPEAAFSRPTDA